MQKFRFEWMNYDWDACVLHATVCDIDAGQTAAIKRLDIDNYGADPACDQPTQFKLISTSISLYVSNNINNKISFSRSEVFS